MRRHARPAARPLLLELRAQRDRGVHASRRCRGSAAPSRAGWRASAGDGAAHAGQRDDLAAARRARPAARVVRAAARDVRRGVTLPPGPLAATRAEVDAGGGRGAAHERRADAGRRRLSRGMAGAPAPRATSAVTMRPLGPVPRSGRRCRCRARAATRRAFGEANSRPAVARRPVAAPAVRRPRGAARRLGHDGAAASSPAPVGSAGRPRRSGTSSPGEQPADQRARRQVDAAPRRRGGTGPRPRPRRRRRPCRWPAAAAGRPG